MDTLTTQQEQQQTNPEPEQSQVQEPEQEPEISIDEDGEVNFSDNFFGDVNDGKPEEEEQETQEQPVQPEQQEQPEETPNNYYTDDELKNTPFDQWDIERLNGDVKKFVPYVQQQMKQRMAAEQMQQQINTAPPLIQEPKTFTPRELANLAQQKAMETLGIQEADDFDMYDPEHQAAYNMALQDFQNQNNAQRARYARQVQEFQDLTRFNISLTTQPDFPEFQKWFDAKLTERGITGQQVNAGFEKYIREQNGNFSDIQLVISKWYQDFKAATKPKPTPKTAPKKAPQAPYLESSYGVSDAVEREVDVRNVGEMDTDGVAKFLMKNGYV